MFLKWIVLAIGILAVLPWVTATAAVWQHDAAMIAAALAQ